MSPVVDVCPNSYQFSLCFNPSSHLFPPNSHSLQLKYFYNNYIATTSSSKQKRLPWFSLLIMPPWSPQPFCVFQAAVSYSYSFVLVRICYIVWTKVALARIPLLQRHRLSPCYSESSNSHTFTLVTKCTYTSFGLNRYLNITGIFVFQVRAKEAFRPAPETKHKAQQERTTRVLHH